MSHSRERLVIFRTGNLGDTMVSIPALEQIRHHFPDSSITLLCNGGIGTQVVAKSVLEGTGLIDDYIVYNTLHDATFVQKARSTISVLLALRSRHFSKVIYLPESKRTAKQVNRDRWFFWLAGFRNILGIDTHHCGSASPPIKPLQPTRSEMSKLLDAVGRMGIYVAPIEKCNHSLRLTQAERNQATKNLPPVTGTRLPIGVAVGSKMASKRWPTDRFIEVITSLHNSHKILPIFVGGIDDYDDSNTIITNIPGGGINFCGKLEIRETAAVLGSCLMYLGVDSGPMHLAASEGIPCVSLFSARDYPGSWYPVGSGHVNIRKSLDCEGCMLQSCHSRNNQCMRDITTDEVIDACVRVINTRRNVNIS
jgi:heptosyltransferase-3